MRRVGVWVRNDALEEGGAPFRGGGEGEVMQALFRRDYKCSSGATADCAVWGCDELHAEDGGGQEGVDVAADKQGALGGVDEGELAVAGEGDAGEGRAGCEVAGWGAVVGDGGADFEGPGYGAGEDVNARDDVGGFVDGEDADDEGGDGEDGAGGVVDDLGAAGGDGGDGDLVGADDDEGVFIVGEEDLEDRLVLEVCREQRAEGGVGPPRSGSSHSWPSAARPWDRSRRWAGPGSGGIVGPRDSCSRWSGAGLRLAPGPSCTGRAAYGCCGLPRNGFLWSP